MSAEIKDKIDVEPSEVEVEVWLREQFEKAREGKPFSDLMKIYPVHARIFLRYNEDNRKLSNLFTNRLSKDIKTDKYAINGESIKFSIDEKLNDGQHRLQAILKSGLPMETFVTFGVTRASRMTLDQGKPRTTANYLSMDGRVNASKAAATAGLLLGFYEFEGKDISKDNVATKQDVRDYYYRNSDEIDFAVSHTNKRDMIPYAPTSALATAYFIIQKIDFDNVDDFYNAFMSGANIDHDSPINYLRSHLVNDNKASVRERIILILQYWIKWKKGEKLKRKVKLQGKYPDLNEAFRKE